jgi:phage shock protein C
MHKKLTRSRTHDMLAGVLGGLSTYLNVDPAIVRILFVLFVIATGFFPGVIAYGLAVFFIPKEAIVTPAAPAADAPAAPSPCADDDIAV